MFIQDGGNPYQLPLIDFLEAERHWGNRVLFSNNLHEEYLRIAVMRETLLLPTALAIIQHKPLSSGLYYVGTFPKSNMVEV